MHLPIHVEEGAPGDTGTSRIGLTSQSFMDFIVFNFKTHRHEIGVEIAAEIKK